MMQICAMYALSRRKVEARMGWGARCTGGLIR